MTTLFQWDNNGFDVVQWTIDAVNEEKKNKHEWIIKTIFIQDVRGRLWTIRPSTPSRVDFPNEVWLGRIFVVEPFDEKEILDWITRMIIPIFK